MELALFANSVMALLSSFHVDGQWWANNHVFAVRRCEFLNLSKSKVSEPYHLATE